MEVRIIDRGRGPELEGTRITIYRVMDYVRAGDAPSLIAEELGLTDEQVRQAFAYIEAHHPDIDAAYDAILDRVNQPNSDWIDEGTAKTWDELRRRIEARSAGEAVDACRRR